MKLSGPSFLASAVLTAAGCVALAWIYTGTMRMYFVESAYSVWTYKWSTLRTCSFGDVLIVGDSRAEAAIIPERLGVSATNVSLGGTTPIETYFIVKQALQCARPPRLVLYDHGIRSFTYVGETLWKSGARLGFMSYADLRAVSATAGDLHDPSVWDENTGDGLRGMARDMAYSFGFPSVFLGSLLEGGMFGRHAHNLAVLGQVTETRGFMPYPRRAGHLALAEDADLQTFQPLPIDVHYFEATLSLLAGAHVPIVFLPTPTPAESAAAIRPDVQAAFQTFLSQELEKFGPQGRIGGAIVEPWPDRYFSDAQHLDPEGARAFTRLLAPCLDQWLSWADHRSAFRMCDLALQ